MTEPLLLTVRQGAALLGIGRDRMYALVAEGSIRSVAVGRKRLVSRAELERWVAAEMEKAS